MAKRNRQQRQSNVHDGARRVRTERNQLTDLIIHGQIVTTHAKAKELQKKMDRLVTMGKKNTLASRRSAAKVLRNTKANEKTALQILFDDISPKYVKRNGGYTRVLKYDHRKGDGTPTSIITFV
ncbi:MAG: 50S ribosomal protein L17 [Mycoplasmataceae bacterium]|nr:50S ribosomal protein L17 [Mycoplasmataceae bacterium]